MTNWQDKTHHGWGRTSAATVPTARPDTMAALAAAWQEPSALLPVGLARSYGDEAVPDITTASTRAILTTQLDRIDSFDPETGVVVAEGGIALSELARLFISKGYFIPAMPGTGFVTLGGAIANDVHGKNHPVMGTFGRHVLWIDLLLPQGGMVRCARDQMPELFFATLGGLGLTGLIVRAALTLLKTDGPSVAVVRERIEDLDALFAMFARTPRDIAPYKVAWIDALSKGEALGRGIFEEATFTPEPANPSRMPQPVMPFDLPNFALNPLSIGLFNTLRYHTVAGPKPKRHLMPYREFFMPLDSILNWNRMYGKRGFHQFQALIPTEVAPHGIRALLQTISQSRRASFLAIIKEYGAEGEGYLSFPMPGFTLALDFPSGPDVPELLARLIGLTKEYGGRVYMAKDSAMTAADLGQMYPRLPLFQQVLGAVDPMGRMRSQMGVRLGLCPTGARA